MKSKLLHISLSLLIVFSISSISFAKQTNKDEETIKRSTKVEKKEPTKKPQTNKTESTKSQPTNVINSQPNDILDIQPDRPYMNSSSATGEQINWQVISAGGNRGTSSNYILSSTMGQLAVGIATSTNYQLNSGFWQTFGGSSGCCVGIRGNVENDIDDIVDISDLVFLVDFMFTDGPAPACQEEGNVEGDVDEVIDISDLVYLVDFMFTDGPAPPSCP